MKALSEQSMIGSPGRLGQATGKTSQSKEYVLTYVGRYNKPEQYENIILKANPDGEILRLKDVGQVELGPQFFDIYSDINGHPAASIVLKQAPGSNAAEVIEEIKAELEQIKKESFPPGMDYEFAYDVSKFLEASIEKVLHTLLEAFILVSLVVYMFLGDLRSTLIPTLAVPVSLVGTFFVLRLMGLSINLITLFAMVLAIGVVVDDAIVVVEAVHAKMAQKHLSPYRATMEVVHEISGAIIAITLVMTSVFVPVTFIPGAVGTFYREFGITMATSIILSGLVALTLTPVLCAMILKPHGHAGTDSHTSDTDPNAHDDTGTDSHTSNGKAARTGSQAARALGGLLVLGGITYLAYELWGPVGFGLILLPLVRRPLRPRRREGHGRLCRDRAADRHPPHADPGRRRGLRRRHRRRQHAARRRASSRARTRASSTPSSRRPRAPRSSTPTPSPRSSRRSPRRSRKSPPSPRWPAMRS